MPQYTVSVLLMCEGYFCAYYLLKIPQHKSPVITDLEIWKATQFRNLQSPEDFLQHFHCLLCRTSNLMSLLPEGKWIAWSTVSSIQHLQFHWRGQITCQCEVLSCPHKTGTRYRQFRQVTTCKGLCTITRST